MSYLGVPRLHFAGWFRANPSTINNAPGNYDHTSNRSQVPISPSWNPYGDASWSIAATVRSFVGPDGVLHDGGDPVIGAQIVSVEGKSKVPAKLVDLDVDQQTRTQLFGLDLTLGGSGSNGSTPLLSGHFDDGARLLYLWFGRVPSAGGDAAASGAFQSVLDAIAWGDLGGSPFLQELEAAAGDGLSIRLSVFGYDSNPQSPTYHSGSIVGTIGPYRAGEPRFTVAGRLLQPTAGSPLYYVPAVVDAGRGVLTLDLGNAVPEQSPGGAPLDLGPMRAAILADAAPVLLGEPIDYGADRYLLTAGVTDVPLTPEQVALAATTPLGIFIAGTARAASGDAWDTGYSLVALAENADGLNVALDLATARLSPGETKSIPLWVTAFGAPKAGYTVPLALMPSPNGPGTNNLPADGVSFAIGGPTDAAGKAAIAVTGGSTAGKPVRRKNIEGQLYFIGGPWAPAADAGITGGPLTVDVYDEVAPIAAPTWGDVAPILYPYYLLYAYMVGIVDLSEYDSVKASSGAVAHVLGLPMSDPLYMPVTRDLSPAKRKIVLDWIAQGCKP